jgi:ActR/RegA family two-component response regulator
MSKAPATAPSASIGTALLVSNDAATIKPLIESMQQLAISTELCAEVATAPGLLNRRRFGAIVVDLQLGDQARTFLEKVRRSPSNRTTMIPAISNSDAETAVAFKDGSNFVLRRPLSESLIHQSLRAAYGLILREQRRYFRCPVEASATLRRPGMEEVRGHLVNISEGGIAIITGVLLKPGVEVQVQFTLPGYESQFAAKSVMCWCQEGYMGLRFISPSRELKTTLQEWLSRRLEQNLPESVAGKFRTLRPR